MAKKHGGFKVKGASMKEHKGHKKGGRKRGHKKGHKK